VAVCNCQGQKRTGEIEGILYTVCLSCQNLMWTATDSKDLISSRLEFKFELQEAGSSTPSRRELLTWVEERIANKMDVHGSLTVDWDYFDDEELDEAIDTVEYFWIDQTLSEWRLEVVDEGEEPYEGQFTSSDLTDLSPSELLKGGVRNLWDHMGEYLQRENAKSVCAVLSGQLFMGLKVECTISETDCIWTLDERW
jgi:hypothetical protein